MKKDELVKIGAIIRIERKNRNFAQQVFADKLYINQSTISRMENGDFNITQEMYEQVLHCFSMSCTSKRIHLELNLYNIYDELDSDTAENIEKIYKKSADYVYLHYADYYINQLIKACYLLYHEDFTKLRELMDSLNEVDFIFNGKIKYIYLMMSGFSHHTTRSYHRADFYFQQTLKFKNQYKLEDGIILYSNAYNHIILGNYRLAHLLILKLVETYKDNYEFRYIMSYHLLGLIYLLDSNYLDSLLVLQECYQHKELFNRSKTLELRLNSHLGIAYLSLNDVKSALFHFENNIKKNYLLGLSYAFVFYCFKKLKMKEQFNYYKEKIIHEEIYQEPNDRQLIDIFSTYENTFNLKLLQQNYNLLYQYIFKHKDRYHYTKLFFQLIKEELWKNRKYLIYKQLNDISLKYRLGGVDFE